MIHDFGVPAFLMKMDVVPGRVNHYVITPDPRGRVPRRPRALRVYHSRMLFEVHVVSREDTTQHVQELEDAGQTSDLPLLGGAEAYTQDGLERRRDRVTATASTPAPRRRPAGSWASRSSGS